MDPLSVTASFIAVVQLTSAVLLGCYRIREQIKDAENEISRVITEMEDLAGILNDLQVLLQLPGDDASKPAIILAGGLSDKSGPLASIRNVLKDLSQKVAPFSRPSLKSKLLWPFESKWIQRKSTIPTLKANSLLRSKQLSIAPHPQRR